VIVDKAAAALTKDALTALRYRNGFVMNAITPLLQLATFYYLSRAVGPYFRPEGVPYFVFLLVGTGFSTFLFSGSHGFLRSIQDAQQTGTLEVLMMSSTPPAVLCALTTLSAFAGAFMQLSVYATLGILLFARDIHVAVLPALAVFVLSLLIAASLGMAAAALQVSLQKGTALLWAVGSASWLLSGTLFPAATLPAPFRIASNLLPFTHALTGMRLAMRPGSNWSALRNEIEALSLIAIVLLPATVCFFDWTVRRARQLGTLSFY
jgi:ABC-type polysaccharide/polyol phosphate export permease